MLTRCLFCKNRELLLDVTGKFCLAKKVSRCIIFLLKEFERFFDGKVFSFCQSSPISLLSFGTN